MDNMFPSPRGDKENPCSSSTCSILRCFRPLAGIKKIASTRMNTTASVCFRPLAGIKKILGAGQDIRNQIRFRPLAGIKKIALVSRTGLYSEAVSVPSRG